MIFESNFQRLPIVLVLCTGMLACSRPPENVKEIDAAPIGGARALVRGLGGEPETLDPRLAADNASLALMSDLYEGLTTERPDGSIAPGAAESWTTSANGTEWTFVLRPGLQWSDGEPLTALHFARGIAKAKAKDSGAPHAPLLAGIRGITVAPGGGALSIQLWRPQPHLPSVLALPVAGPEPARVDGSGNVGNGPYRLISRRPGEPVELERNPHYHGRAGVAVERITWLTLDDLDAELNLYRAGQLDVTSEVPNARIDGLPKNLGAELYVSPHLSTYGYALNVTRLDDPEARSALAMGIDRDRITSQVTDGGERAAFEWVAPGIVGYPNPRFQWAVLGDGERVEEARRHWRNASVRGKAPARLVLCTDASANHGRIAAALADQWQSTLDVEVELVELARKSYLAERARPGRCDLVRFGWSADYADPEAFLELFESRHPQNTQGYSSVRFDTLLYESRRAGGAEERLRRLAEAERVLLEDVAVIPVFHRVSKRLIKPEVTGFADHPLGHLASRQLRWRNDSSAVSQR